MKTHSESPLDSQTQSLLDICVEDGLKFFGLTAADRPEAVIAAVDQYVYDWQRGALPAERKLDAEEAPYLLGALWGQQFVRQFGWRWVNITFLTQGNVSAPGVVSPEAALVVYPIHFVIGCLQNPTVDGTLALAFNLLAAGQAGGVGARSYFNLMDGVQRVVPR